MGNAASTSTAVVPFFRPDIRDAEIDEVVHSLRSGWITSGPKVRRFEAQFAEAVGARYAVALNSCTAALHLAAEALHLREGQRVLVPTMTFAATAEVVRYLGGVPILVDCDPATGNLDLADAQRKLHGAPTSTTGGGGPVVGLMPVHVSGHMLDIDAVGRLAAEHGLWLIEDAAHAFPAAWRRAADAPWQRCGEGTATITCFSFYANKTITTGEGGMAVTDDRVLASRMRIMSLHGLSHDAWDRYNGGGWDYRIVAPGFKYNLTDIAAAIGLHQLARADAMRAARARIAGRYRDLLADVAEIELPPDPLDRQHAWHLFPIRLRLSALTANRDQVMAELKQAGVMTSVHWRPLHLHPYYQHAFGYRADDCPNATALFDRLISLPLFSTMTDEEIERVASTVKHVLARHGRPAVRRVAGSRS
jgi:perosamine synthetase